MRTRRLLATTAAAAMSLSLVAAQEAPTTIDATETFYISAGCPTDATGQCTSTRWLGKVSGDATSNFITAITPVDEVLHQVDGSINWRDYASDHTFADYLLDVDRDLGVTVTLSSSAQAGAGAMVTVHARVKLRVVGADGSASNETLTAEPQVINAMTTLDGPVPVEFALDLPAEWAGHTLDRMTVEVAVHGLNVQNGYIDQQGGSPVTVPHIIVED